MLKKIFQLISGEDCELRERMFRSIIFVGGLAAIIGTAEIFFVMKIDSILLPVLLLLILVMGISLFVTFKYRKYDLAAALLGVVIITTVFPILFLLSGGIECGASVWLALGILYIFVMFNGKRLCFFLILCAVSYGATYAIALYYPELIVPMPSRTVAYLDSLFSVFVVGCVAGFIPRAHMSVFEKEHKLNIAQKEELENNNNSQKVFFANMNHEIRTPINSIIGLNEMILRENPTDAIKEYALNIQMASNMLLNQVNDILDFSQIEINRMKIVSVQYQTSELFRELLEMIRVQSEKKGLELYLDIDKKLPSVLYGDEKRIKQVLLNILDNAVKYTQEGSVTLTVQGEECGDDEISLKVQIADTGIGIRKEDIEYLYDVFNRANEKRNTRIMGSGLGLTITKQLLELMGGEITVDSIYTKGTVFTILLKQKIVEAKPIGDVTFLGNGQGSELYQPIFEAPEARILLVDDNHMNALVASRLLAATKVQVDVASSGAECLEMTRSKFYHVILLDYMMPDMNGSETLKELRKQENGLCRDSAVIVLTANALSGARQLYLDLGFDAYVEKPIKGKTLETEILQLLPADIIEYRETENVDAEVVNQIQKITMQKRKKKIYITSDCTCDIPSELLEKYNIKLMYLYIKTPNGRFADTREIDSGSLAQYLSADSSSAYADGVTVEEYEEFFAETLSQAERVIHISMSSGLGKSYNVAVTAARNFDHVRVIDSAQISCGQGLTALAAAKMALEGKTADEICSVIEKMKGKVQSRFIMPGVNILYQNGRMHPIAMKFCKLFQLHPMLAFRQKKLVIIGWLGGTLENAWKLGISRHLWNKRKIDRSVVFITHVGCSVKQLEWIQKEVLKRVPFEKVIVQRASFTNACSSGRWTIGISYYSL